MPRLTAPSPEREFTRWLATHPCPQPGDESKHLNPDWLPKAAGACHWMGIPAEKAVQLLRGAMTRPEKGNEVSRAVERIYGGQLPASTGRANTGEPKSVYNPQLLAARAALVPEEITAKWLMANSPVPVSASPAEFLAALFPGERAFVSRNMMSKDGYLFEGLHESDELNQCLAGNKSGCWYLANPVDGQEHDGSIRSEASLTAYRQIVLESDQAPADQWLRMLVQEPLAIVALVHSGNKSVHALVRIQAGSKAEFEQVREELKRKYVPLGADPQAMSAVRLTRLANVFRNDTGAVQRLLWLNPDADGSPIYKTQNPVEGDGALSDQEELTYEETNNQDLRDNQEGNDYNMKNETNTNGATMPQTDGPCIDGGITDECRAELNRRVPAEWIEKWKNHPDFAHIVIGKSLNVLPRENSAFSKACKEGMGAIVEFVNDSGSIPFIESYGSVQNEVIVRPPTIVEGLLKRSEKMVLGGPSKSRKTWAMMNLSVSVSAGTDWLGFQTMQGKVLYVNFELHRHSFWERVDLICKSRGVDVGEVRKNLYAIHLRDQVMKPDDIIKMIVTMARPLDLSIIILDPTYKMLGDLDENKAGDMAKLLSHFTKLAGKLKVAVVFATHFPKGNMNKRESMDRLVGSGVLARDPDAIVTMTPLTKKELGSLIKMVSGKATKRQETGPSDEHIKLLETLGDGKTHAEWCDGAAVLELSKSTLTRRFNDLVNDGLAKKKERGKGARYTITDKGREAILTHDEGRNDESTPAEGLPDTSSLVKGFVHKLEFDLRDDPEQESFTVEFHDYVHHKVGVELPEDGQEEGESGQGDETEEAAVPCKITMEGREIVATCSESGYQTRSIMEGPTKKAGAALRRNLVLMDEECSCGGRHTEKNGSSELGVF